MAIYHLSMKAISRSDGRSSTAAAAYRAGCEMIDRRTGETHDYRRKRGVESSSIVMPNGMRSMSRDELWNGVELHLKRGDATVAREFEVALPAELSMKERNQLALDFAIEVANHYQVAADVCIHEPSTYGDNRNYHAHILFSACTINTDGFGKKAAALDPIHCKRNQLPTPADLWRKRWADLINERLSKYSIDALVDHRSLEAQGIDRVPTVHLGQAVIGMERRAKQTRVKARINEQIENRLQQIKELTKQLGEIFKQISLITSQILNEENLMLAGAASGEKSLSQNLNADGDSGPQLKIAEDKKNLKFSELAKEELKVRSKEEESNKRDIRKNQEIDYDRGI